MTRRTCLPPAPRDNDRRTGRLGAWSRAAGDRPFESFAAIDHDFTPIPANPAVPDLGYLLDSGQAALAYSCDTVTFDGLTSKLERVFATQQVFLAHRKPGEGAYTMQEISEVARQARPRMLENHQEFTI